MWDGLTIVNNNLSSTDLKILELLKRTRESIKESQHENAQEFILEALNLVKTITKIEKTKITSKRKRR